MGELIPCWNEMGESSYLKYPSSGEVKDLFFVG